ncbi:phospholipid scramblase 1-like isoform X2 [Pleurodeles waltl]|uniref:phospholipid scramblase 1-like isoform X2 n=1 Tax=Pleurodeles waltl TaxID=8319 RepID=UPI003709C216
MSAPAYTSKGMELNPPSYDAIQPTGPGIMNIPLQPQGFPVTQQTAIMPYVAEIHGVPPGLEYLTQIDHVVIHEKFSSAQRWGRNYEIVNSLNQRMFFAKQEVKCCCPLYDLHVLDNNNREVMQFLQQCQCTCCSSEVKSNDETQTVGLIRRDSGHFSVQFPLDLDVMLKAVLIGSCFFLDHMIYARRQQMLQAQASSSSD